MMKVSVNVRCWRWSILLLTVGTAVGPLSDSVAGQTRRSDAPRERRQGARGEVQLEPGVAAAEIQRMLDGYELMQANQMLGIDDDQLSRFLPRLRDLQDARRRVRIERNRVVRELRRLTQASGGATDEARIREEIKALDDLEVRSAAEVRQAREALDQVLDPRQQARFRIFEEMMEQRKVELLMRARQANRPQYRPQGPPVP